LLRADYLGTKRKEAENRIQSFIETSCLQGNIWRLEKRRKKKFHFQIPGLSVLQDQDPRGKDFCENGSNESIPL